MTTDTGTGGPGASGADAAAVREDIAGLAQDFAAARGERQQRRQGHDDLGNDATASSSRGRSRCHRGRPRRNTGTSGSAAARKSGGNSSASAH